MWSRPLALALLLLPGPALAGVEEKVAALAPRALVLVVDAKGNELVAQNIDEPFVPASVTKIVTAWLAMEVLGGDYRFETRFYLDDKRVLYVRGGGDPFLISEELAPLATELVAAVGKKPITGIVLDASYYPSNLRIPGIVDTGEAYNALNSALAVNFNTVYAVRSGNKVRSAEKQTPITPLAIAQFRLRRPNGSGRISLSQDPKVSLQYAGELIAAFIERAGGSVKGKISTGTVPEGLKPIYVHRQSRTLSEILVELLRASNNYIANQVFLEIGAHRLGGPVSLEKSLQVANEMLAAHGLAAAIHLEEVIGYLPQDVELFAGSVAENIARFEVDREPGAIIKAAQAAGVHEMILRLPNGYETQIGEAGQALSAGQRQRIGLARALYDEPFLVVLDEPNANLDAEGDEALTKAALGVRTRGGIIVVIAHRPSALAAASHVLIMQHGRVTGFKVRQPEVVQDKHLQAAE